MHCFVPSIWNYTYRVYGSCRLSPGHSRYISLTEYQTRICTTLCCSSKTRGVASVDFLSWEIMFGKRQPFCEDAPTCYPGHAFPVDPLYPTSMTVAGTYNYIVIGAKQRTPHHAESCCRMSPTVEQITDMVHCPSECIALGFSFRRQRLYCSTLCRNKTRWLAPRSRVVGTVLIHTTRHDFAMGAGGRLDLIKPRFISMTSGKGDDHILHHEYHLLDQPKRELGAIDRAKHDSLRTKNLLVATVRFFGK
jgi:hypothetical protein